MMPFGSAARTPSATRPNRKSIRSIGTDATKKIAAKSAAMMARNTPIPSNGWVSAASMRSMSAPRSSSMAAVSVVAARTTLVDHAASAAGVASAGGNFCKRAINASLSNGRVVTVSSATSSAASPSPLRPETGTTGHPSRRASSAGSTREVRVRATSHILSATTAGCRCSSTCAANCKLRRRLVASTTTSMAFGSMPSSEPLRQSRHTRASGISIVSE